MRKKRQTTITIDTHRVMILRQHRSGAQAWCPRCAGRVEMLPAEKAAAAAGLSCRTIYRWVEAEMVHFVEEAGGQLLICPNSLIALHDHSRSKSAGDRLGARLGRKEEKNP